MRWNNFPEISFWVSIYLETSHVSWAFLFVLMLFNVLGRISILASWFWKSRSFTIQHYLIEFKNHRFIGSSQKKQFQLIDSKSLHQTKGIRWKGMTLSSSLNLFNRRTIERHSTWKIMKNCQWVKRRKKKQNILFRDFRLISLMIEHKIMERGKNPSLSGACTVLKLLRLV